MNQRLLAALVACGLCLPAWAGAPDKGDPAYRGAAQRGLTFLSEQSRAWTQGHPNCYGCHVHSVTLEGLSIGKANRYDVAAADLKLMAEAMLSSGQGVHTTTYTTARAFGGVAFARYDQLVDGAYHDELLKVARRLRDDQHADGSVKVDDVRFPIESGVMQATYQAMQTWRQAYARTADDAWLTPLRKAEEFIQVSAAAWPKGVRAPMQSEPPLAAGLVPLEDLNYALLGLTAAGVGTGEKLSVKLQTLLLERQNHDGGWGFAAASDGFATGQTVYALRAAGRSEKDGPVARGMAWLVEHQAKNGGWGGAVSTSGNSGLGEAMWAVMGLVTVDVMTVAVSGLTDGQHVEPSMTLTATAKDNAKGGGVVKVELFADDLPLAQAQYLPFDPSQAPRANDPLVYTWKTERLAAGKHLVDVVATNAKGETSRRRYEVYAGDVFLTQVGSRFDAARQVTDLTFRDIAPEALTRHTVALEIFAVDLKNGSPTPGKRVFGLERAGAAGAQTLSWSGANGEGVAQPRGRYFAQVSLKDRDGKVLQTERVLVFHEREELQQKQFAEVEGTLGMSGGVGLSANTEVELVDEHGAVVQRTTSTAQGNYRFKNVDQGKYSVRAKKAGFKDQESKVEAAPAAAPARADLKF